MGGRYRTLHECASEFLGCIHRQAERESPTRGETATGLARTFGCMSNERTEGRPEGSLATVSLVLGVAGLLPIPGLPAAVAAAICGGVARSHDRRCGRAAAGFWLGVIGVIAPLVALLVYFVVLGYPFPIRRYRP